MSSGAPCRPTYDPNRSLADVYKSEQKRREAAQIDAIGAEITAFAREERRWRSTFASNDPLPAPPSADSTRAAIEPFRTCYAGAVAKATSMLDAGEANDKGLLEDEAKCRATPSCVGPRMAEHICGWINDRRAALHDIQAERQNPGGVVDLQKLHDLGETVQALDAQIAPGKAQYAKTMSKPFNEATCPKETANAPR